MWNTKEEDDVAEHGDHHKSDTADAFADDVKWNGFGFVLTYNTDIGHDDPEVIKTVQSGKKGKALTDALAKLEIFVNTFDHFWEFINGVALKHKLLTINCCLEHSENGDHAARVHLHACIGLDIRGGVHFADQINPKCISQKELRWKGIGPNVKPTRVMGKSQKMLFTALVTASYYVAGPKHGTIFKRSTFKPMEDFPRITI